MEAALNLANNNERVNVMPKLITPLLVALTAIFTAYTAAGLASPTLPGNEPVAVANAQSPVIETRPAVAITSTNQTTRPRIITELDLGVRAGNGYFPQQVALDAENRQLYTLNSGLAALDAGNTISVIDLDTNQVTALLKLNNQAGDHTFTPTPLDLQLDPYRARLYALTGAPTTTLIIIDTDNLIILDTLSGVEALAPGPDRLYLASDTRLWAIDPDSLVELAAQELEPLDLSGPLRLEAGANRLYLGRGRPWSLDSFAAETLTPIDSQPIVGELMQAVIDEVDERLLILASDGGQITLRALDGAGRPLTVSETSYGRPSLALTAETLYLVADDAGAYILQTISVPELTLVDSQPLPLLPNDLTADPDSGLLYAALSSPGSTILTLDPLSGLTEPIATAVDIIDLLPDPALEHLYVFDDQGNLHVLSSTDYNELDRIDTGLGMLNHENYFLAELALDPGRQRLYLSGDPVRTIDTASLELTVYADARGQLTPDPAGDRLYLTPPCQCRLEQCNTLILDAKTMTGAATLFPPQDPLEAVCVVSTRLDPENRLLYATIDNVQPGSNSGAYFVVFDTEPPAPPEQIYVAPQISYGELAIDSPRARAFAPRRRQEQTAIDRFERRGQSFTQTLSLASATGHLAYDPQADRLYAIHDTSLQLFDGELTLLVEMGLPGRFAGGKFDAQNQRLYLFGEGGKLLVIAPDGGKPESPVPVAIPLDPLRPLDLFITPTGIRFRLTDGQLSRSSDDGRTWQPLGAGLPKRPVAALAVSPDYEQAQTLLAGLGDAGQGGGLYRSTDGGDTWFPTNHGLTDLRIQQIVFSPTFAEDQTIFLNSATYGLFRSTNGGDTWRSLAETYADDPFDRSVSSLAVSPTFAADGQLIIGAVDLLRSTDGGESWQTTGLPAGRVAYSPDFARDHLILSEGRWRSTDGGESWQPAAAGLAQTRFGARRIFFSPDFSADQTVYVLLEADFDRPLILQRSVDAGRTWQSLLGGLPPGFELAAATLLPDGDLYLGAAAGELLAIAPASLDWGRPLVDIAQLDLQDLAVGPDGSLYVSSSTAGVFKSLDEGRTWSETDFPARANATQPARLALAADGALFAAAGSALERSADGGKSWTYLADVPAGFTIASLAVSPDFGSDGVSLAGGDFTQNSLIRSADGGDTWTTVFEGTTIPGASDLSLLAFSPNVATDQTAYAWLQQVGLLRSTDGGQHWTIVTTEASEERFLFGQALAVSPDGERLYLGALDGKLLVSSDGGQSWRSLDDTIPDDRVWSSALALTPDGTIFLGTDIGVYRSQDDGQSWQRASTGLPSSQDRGTPPGIHTLRFHEDRLYAALTEGGLYVSDDRGETWRSTLN